MADGGLNDYVIDDVTWPWHRVVHGSISSTHTQPNPTGPNHDTTIIDETDDPVKTTFIRSKQKTTYGHIILYLIQIRLTEDVVMHQTVSFQEE